MKIGFDIQYKPHDAVYAALRLSDSLKAIGYETTLFSKIKRHYTYGCDWDSMVVTPYHMSYEHWLSSITHIIWPSPPNKDIVSKAGKNVVTISLAPWDCLPAYTKKSFKLCAHTVATCKENYEILKSEFGLSNVVLSEWDSYIPTTRKAKNAIDFTKPKVLIPMHSSQGLRCDLDALFEVIVGLNLECPKAELTLSYSPKCVPWHITNEIRKFLHRHSGNARLHAVVDSPTCVSSLLLYGDHDLVLWPAEIEGFGLVGIESLYMGTPVIAYDIPPISGIITDGVNGLLVPCKKSVAGGSTYAQPDPKTFISVAAEAINNQLVELGKHTRIGRKTKRTKFNSTWKKIIEG